MKVILNEQEASRVLLGDKLIRALSWRGDEPKFFSSSILDSDKETKDILIKETDLLRLIQFINPIQKDRHIRLI